MPVPIICLDEEVRHFAERSRGCLSKPQYQHFVTVLAGLMQCEGRRVLCELLRQVGEAPSLAALSRFLSRAPWDELQMAEQWLKQCREVLQPMVDAEIARQRQVRSKQRGRPKAPLVTGYLIGDDSTMHKPKGKKMQGLGKHHSTTHEQRVVGHNLVAGLYVLLGRRCPLAPRLYRQQKVCEKEQIAFQSRIAVMERLIRTFEPVGGTLTHVLLDSWYCVKVIWKAARARGFLITSGVSKGAGIPKVIDFDVPMPALLSIPGKLPRLLPDVTNTVARFTESKDFPPREQPQGPSHSMPGLVKMLASHTGSSPQFAPIHMQAHKDESGWKETMIQQEIQLFAEDVLKRPGVNSTK